MSINGSESRSAQVLELAEEFLESYRAGRRPSLKEYADRHPELAAEIREVFPAMAMMENIAIADDSLAGDSDATIVGDPAGLSERLGDYRVLREIGRGGMGVVYEAEQVSLGRHVALKVLPPHVIRDEKTRRRFEREARAAAKLHHTNIVPVFGVGEQGDTPYYVMQFIQGQGLDAVLDELKRLRAGAGKEVATVEATVLANGRDASAADVARSLLTGGFEPRETQTAATADRADDTASLPGTVDVRVGTGEGGSSKSGSSSSLSLPGERSRGKGRRNTYWQGVARIGEQVADALAYAHGQGIVHRDIKPSNLLLDTRGIVWVTDFGLAKTDDGPNLTHTGDILGTLRYMPPEAFGGKVDARGDVYSLGLTLYELLAFRPAFDEKERGRLVQQVMNDAPPPLRKLNPEAPRDLETIVHKAIERETSHRYSNASELADDLRRFVDDEPIRARRASIPERLARWGRRNPALAGLSAAVGLLLISVIAVLWRSGRTALLALETEKKLHAEADLERRNARRAADALAVARDDIRSTLYAAQMNLTRIAWDSGNPRRALELLDASAPKPGESDLRGFEWYYWRNLVRGERSVRQVQGDAPRMGGFSPDGESVGASMMYSGNRGSPVRFWLHETKAGGASREFAVATPLRRGVTIPVRITASSDGKRVGFSCYYASIVKGLQDRETTQYQSLAVVVDRVDGRELLRVEEDRVDPSSYYSVSFDKMGSRVAIGHVSAEKRGPLNKNAPRSIRILEVPGGRELARVSEGSAGLRSADLSPDGRLLATCSLDGRLLVTEIADGRARYDSSSTGIKAVSGARFSPDGGRLTVVARTPDGKGRLAIIDLGDGGRTTVEPFIEEREYDHVRFAPDGRFVYGASRNNPKIQVHDGFTGRVLRALELGVDGFDDVAVRSSDGRLLTIKNQVLREWDLPAEAQGSADQSRLISDKNIMDVIFTDGGRRLVGERRLDAPPNVSEFFVHDVSNSKPAVRFGGRTLADSSKPLSPPYYTGFQPSQNGEKLAATSRDDPADMQSSGPLRVWNLKDGSLSLELDDESLGLSPGDRVYQPWDAAGTRMAFLGYDRRTGGRKVSIIEFPSGRVSRTIALPVGSTQLALRPDGKLLAIGVVERGVEEMLGRVDLVDPETGQTLQSLRCGIDIIGGLWFSSDGRRLAALRAIASSPNPILLWSLPSGSPAEPLRLDGHGLPVSALAFSPDGRRLASAAFGAAAEGGEVKIWDTASGRELLTLKLSQGRPMDLAFHPADSSLRIAYITAAPESAVGVLRLDAAPPRPEVEAFYLVERLGKYVWLNEELVAKIQAEPGLTDELRSAAIGLARSRFEDLLVLDRRSSSIMSLDASMLSPELLERASAYAERAAGLMGVENLDYGMLRLRGMIRYRLGRYEEAREALRKSLQLEQEDQLPIRLLGHDTPAFLAMTEAKLGRRAEAEAALASHREIWAKKNPQLKTPPPRLAEIESVFRESFGTTEPSTEAK